MASTRPQMMSPVNIWTFLLLLFFNCIACSKGCVWLQNSHKDLSNKMINNFEHMVPENETSDDCLTNITLPDLSQLYKIYKVDSAAIVVHELFHLTSEFYKMHQNKLVSNQTAWEQLQEDLHHLMNLLKGCISGTTEKPPSLKNMYEYFRKLKEILQEQEDTACAQRIIHGNIKYNLLKADRLSVLMRKYFKKTAV